MESAVTEATKNIIWESACFDATAVRLTAQRHGIRTDASTRYEKSLDPLLAGYTFGRVIEYMKFLRKEVNITGTSSYLDESRVNDITIEVDHDFIDMKAGLKIPKKEARDILECLGFEVSVIPCEKGETTEKKSFFSAKIEVSLQNEEENECLSIRVPSWRASKDINIKEDIAEEVARVYGYDRTPLSPLSSSFSIAKKNHEIAFRDTTLDHWKSSNWHEVYGYSFTNASLDAKIGKSDMTDAVGIQNAWNEEYTHMRRSLAPRLFIALAENTKYRDRFGFFEIGKVYSKNTIDTLNDSLLQTIAIKPFSEKKMLAGALIGSSIEMLRADIEGYLMKTLGYIPPVHTGTQSSIYHPGISGSYRLEDDILISFGEVHPSVANAFDLPEHVLYFEADYEMIFARSLDRDTRFQNISRYQTIARELNFVMDTHTPTGDIARIIDAVHPWITEVHVDSVFTDETKI